MTDFYRTKRFNADSSSFGGIIYTHDFDAHTTMADIARRIASDLRFDEQCRKNIENRERDKK